MRGCGYLEHLIAQSASERDKQIPGARARVVCASNDSQRFGFGYLRCGRRVNAVTHNEGNRIRIAAFNQGIANIAASLLQRRNEPCESFLFQLAQLDSPDILFVQGQQTLLRNHSQVLECPEQPAKVVLRQLFPERSIGSWRRIVAPLSFDACYSRFADCLLQLAAVAEFDRAFGRHLREQRQFGRRLHSIADARSLR